MAAAVIAFLVADPDAGCHYDCMGRLAWAVVAVGAAGGWLLGCAIAFGIAQSLRRR
jgi:hypothetical protein